MCARYNLRSSPQALAEYFETAPLEPPVTLPLPNFNVAPTQQAPVVVDEPRRFEVMRWGLIPFWSKDPRIGRRTINARAETVAEKPSFRAAFRTRRCLVPADGFYEWTGPRGKRQPLNIHRADGQPLALAGLWESHDEFGPTFTIITTAPNAYMSTIHNRMPVVLEPGDWDAWLAAERRRPGLARRPPATRRRPRAHRLPRQPRRQLRGQQRPPPARIRGHPALALNLASAVIS